MTGARLPPSRLALLLPLLAGGGCSYLSAVNQQKLYAWQQGQDPRQRVYKHMVDRDTFFVFGEVRNAPDRRRAPLAVAAVSDAFRPGEVVDVNHFSRQDSFYGLHLPAGEYRLLVVQDLDGDGVYEEREVLGGRAVRLGLAEAPDRVLGAADIDLRLPIPATAPGLRIPVQRTPLLASSAVYPEGTLRSLDDEIFSPGMATMGLYEPAAFLERAPMMFYALEEDAGYKVPVIFVHGIEGSARQFAELVAHLDRRRYRPWFFHYPSGSSLGQLAELFYRIFLSGKVIPQQGMPVVVVAHSMGGLVVREALNRCTGAPEEATVARLVTIASPMGGHPAAAGVERAPLVLPSWRDLNPQSAFVQGLHRRPLPEGLAYHLLYTLGEDGSRGRGEPGDGVVPLSSQLAGAARAEASEQLGLEASHAGVLRDPRAIRHVVGVIEEVRSPFPEEHLRWLDQGGYPVALGPAYTPLEAYLIHSFGRWLDALASGEVAPFLPVQAHFVAVTRGEAAPENPAEKAWVKFARDYPDRRALDVRPAAAGAP